MMKPMMQTPLIELSEQVYRALLIFYPAEYRREYGPLMVQVFRDICRDAYRQNGAWGVLESWLPVLLDLAITAVEEHRKRGFRMSKSPLIRWSGPILIVAGVLFIVFSVGWLEIGVAWLLFPPAQVLLAIGLVGVLLRLTPRINRLGRLGLMVAIACATGGAILFLLAQVGILAWNVMGNIATPLFLLQYFSMMVFGITTIQARALPRWNVLPVLIGLLPVLIFVTNADEQRGGPNYIAFGVIVLVGLGYALLGYVVHSDISGKELAAA